ncbi:FAD synthetase family protein [Variovorax sp. YR216]|uniref:FAD synthetase family protein n=1 Tax=Variovorax sp. YR216 TaxID=1882828 RepID=UPI00089C14B1|nr:FAD synthetase family protein [Variovorax sp. YR216]SEB25916.1 riboflavin kinase / FMN adenylyltransferase [Variovorax sp. YR216]
MKLLREPASDGGIDQATGGGPEACVATIGMFDGVHRGHRQVLANLRARGEWSGLPTALVTFDPHPRAVLRGDAGAPKLLSSLADRLQLLAATGAVDYALVLRFDAARAGQSADEFVSTVLLRQLGMRQLVVGENFACGRGRQGSVDYLADLGIRLGFSVSPVALDSIPALGGGSSGASVRSSSTEARRLISLGDLAGASAVLERPHELTGIVTRSLSRVGASRVVEAELPATMCAPAAADYVGEVRPMQPGGGWFSALLHVGGQSGQTVRFEAARDLEARRGDPLRLRFVGRASGRAPIQDRTFA